MIRTRRTFLLSASAGLATFFMASAAQESGAVSTVPAAPLADCLRADVFAPSAPGQVRLGGTLGARLSATIENQVMAQNIDRIVQPYRDKKEVGDGDWRCEYWGKWATSAALACRYEATPGHHEVLAKGVRELLATQDQDGYIGTRKPEHHLKGWDVWGRKYVLLGLLADYDLTGDPAILAAAKRHADRLLSECGPGKVNIAAIGYANWKGLPPSSVLEPAVLLYQRTGEKKYLEFAEYIVGQWRKPNPWSPDGLRLVEEALAGKPAAQIGGAPKAYEMMSCYEGLCELYRVTGNRSYLDAAVKLADSIFRDELTVIGSGSSQELWCGGRSKQDTTDPLVMETCVTVTWMKFCNQLLRLTGDPRYADALETSLYNALLGALTPEGHWWAYASLLSGERVPSHVQQADVGTCCCPANGPRALLLTPAWAVMAAAAGPVVNLYNPGTADLRLQSGTRVRLVQETDYPVGDTITLKLLPEKSETFTLALRIPAWSERNTLLVNGKERSGDVKPGTYVKIERTWSAGDTVELRLVLRGRVLSGPAGKKHVALARGPLVLALDSRLRPGNVPADLEVKPLDGSAVTLVRNVAAAEKAGVRLAFDAAFTAKDGTQHTLTLCDYASAGNTWDERSLYRIWLPQPLDCATVLKDLPLWPKWGWVKERPVMPPVPSCGKSSACGGTLPLQGDWGFRLDPDDVGEKEAWQNRSLPDTIRLPGSTDQAGYGEKTKGVEGRGLVRVFKYIGPAWYQREVEIPSTWEGKEAELFLERVLWQSKVWVDGRPCNVQDSLGTPHLFRLGKLSPGKHRLTIRVNNQMIHPIGRIGQCYTEDTQTIWNGIVGRMELRARGALRIQRQRIFTQDDGTVRVELNLQSDLASAAPCTVKARVFENATGALVGTFTTNLTMAAEGSPAEKEVGPAARVAELTVKLDAPPKPWSEFTPVLYRVETQVESTLGGLQAADSASDSFGFRTLGRRGQHITVNGLPTFFRGNQECGAFPLTGYPPCDVESWRRIFRIYREHNLNQVRFHSWCPPEAAFQAADELGIYIQAEILWTLDHPDSGGAKGIGMNEGTVDRYTRAEMRRMLDTYGNHPSFLFFVIGNELGSSNFKEMAQWVGEEKARDPRRLYAASTARAITPTDDFADTHYVPNVGQVVNRLGVPHTDWDYEDAYRRAPVPVIAHEAGQMPVYPDWSEIGKYTGVLQARNLEAFRGEARKNGIETQSRELQLASGASSRIIYKGEMEAQLRSASAGGFNWLSMQDYPGQGTALVGWLDVFYDSKGIVSPDRFRRTCSETVPLARFKKYVWTKGETFQATAQVAHWGAQPLAGATVLWKMREASGRPVAEGSFEPTDLAVGSLKTLGPISVALNAVGQATRLNLEISVRNTPFVNDWDVWVFPEDGAAEAPANVTVCDRMEPALDALKKGQRVLLLAHGLGSKDNRRYAAWKPVFWMGAWKEQNPDTEILGARVNREHPALAGFPTDSHLDWQWHDLCDGARGFVLDTLPPDYLPIVQPVSDFRFSHKLGSLFELGTKDGGRLLVCGYNLSDKLAERPAARELRRSLLKYAAGPAFAPKQLITEERLIALFSEVGQDKRTRQ